MHFVRIGCILLCFVSLSCSRKPESRFDKNEVIVGAVDGMMVINPLLSTDIGSATIQCEIWQGLNGINPKTYELMPVIASLPAISEDKRTYYYYINSKARWSDDVKVTPADVIFTFKVVLNQYSHADSFRAQFGELDSVWAFNDSIVCFRFSKIKFNRDNDIATILILPKHRLDSAQLSDRITWAALKNDTPSALVQQVGTMFARSENLHDLSKYIGSGPYMFEDLELGAVVKLKKNPRYWAENVPGLEAFPDRIIYRVMGDEVAREVALKAGDIDITHVSADQYRYNFPRAKYPHIKLDTVYDVNYGFIQLNNEDPLFRSPAVRRALAMLVDRDAMIKAAFLNAGKKVDGPVSPLQPGYNPKAIQAQYNPVLARSILASEGWHPSPWDGTLEKVIHGKRVPFKFNLMQPGVAPQWLMLVEAYRKVGITVNLQILDFSIILENLRERRYQAYAGLITGDPTEPDLYPQFHSSQAHAGGLNQCCYANPKADSLMELIRVNLDVTSRRKQQMQLQQIIADDQPMIFMFGIPIFFAWNDRFENVHPRALFPWVDPRYFRLRQQ